jgi:hypothetical protein
MAITTSISRESLVNQLMLEKVRVLSQERLSGQLLADLNFESYRDDILGDLVLRLSSYVMAEETNKIKRSLSYPSNWWQMFKQQYFPEWLKEKFPVKTKTKSWTVRVMATYPKLPQVFKDQKAVFRYLVNENY